MTTKPQVDTPEWVKNAVFYQNEEESLNYKAWWNLPALPKFNTDNPGVRDFIFEVARYWMEFGIDGWRLDVADEIDDESFWREFRTVVKSVKSDAYICAEIWVWLIAG